MKVDMTVTAKGYTLKSVGVTETIEPNVAGMVYVGRLLGNGTEAVLAFAVIA
jgi:hypothetical protein